MNTFVLVTLACLGALAAVFFWRESKRRQQALEIMTASFENEMSSRREAEASRQKLEKALLQGQKLQAIGTLAGGIAHDFNNILYAILGYVEMAREDLAKDNPLYSNLGKVLSAARRGQDLVSRILAFSRRQQQTPLQPVSLREAVEGALALLRPATPASVVIDTRFAEGNFVMEGSPTQLHQVMVNLVTNAVDAMEGEGHLKVSLDLPAPGDSLLDHLPPVPAGYCRLTVTDTGHGMDRATQERIFEPFFTTKEPGRGTGLGLSTVYSIVTELKGEIMVESSPEHGSSFTLLFPLHSDQEGTLHHGQNPAG